MPLKPQSLRELIEKQDKYIENNTWGLGEVRRHVNNAFALINIGKEHMLVALVCLVIGLIVGGSEGRAITQYGYRVAKTME